MEQQNKQKRESFIVEIGPLLKKILEEQMNNIKEATYDCVKPSHYEAGEIVAKKIIQTGGIKIPKKEAV